MMMSKGYDIPLELQIEIMKRLPIQSLLKFRSVSKPWKSIISSSEFIADYNNHAHHYNPRQLLVSSNHDRVVYILDDDDKNNPPLLKYSLSVNIILKYPLSSVKPSWISLIGYSQGLFGIFNYYQYHTNEHVVAIWNPSIRKSVVIPVPNAVPSSTVFGFGVRNATDPIIVMIHDKLDTISSQVEVEVFTLSSKVCRSLSNVKCLPIISLHLTWKVVTIDNLIYWLAFYEGVHGPNSLILSFDMIREEFKKIDLPPVLSQTFHTELKLSTLRDSLVVLQTITYQEEEYKWMYDVWIMREDGVQNSFKKLYTINQPDTSKQWVCGFRHNGQPIIKRVGYAKRSLFLVYDPDSACFNDIGGDSWNIFMLCEFIHGNTTFA